MCREVRSVKRSRRIRCDRGKWRSSHRLLCQRRHSAMIPGMLLSLIILLPFLGSLCAAALPANARNAEAWLAGLVSVTCVALVVSLSPDVVDGGVVRITIP